MKKTTAIRLTVLATVICAGPLQAHHSGSMYQRTPVWVSGTVVRFEHVNPHTVISLEDRRDDGQVRLWAIEGPGQSQLDSMGLDMDAPEVGDVVSFCGFPYKSPEELSQIFPGVDFSASRASRVGDDSARFLAGHVMLVPNGDLRFWEPHGVLAECIRSSNQSRQSWLDFLDTDARARRGWCEQRQYPGIQSNAALSEFIEEINGQLDDPCP